MYLQQDKRNDKWIQAAEAMIHTVHWQENKRKSSQVSSQEKLPLGRWEYGDETSD